MPNKDTVHTDGYDFKVGQFFKIDTKDSQLLYLNGRIARITEVINKPDNEHDLEVLPMYKVWIPCTEIDQEFWGDELIPAHTPKFNKGDKVLIRGDATRKFVINKIIDQGYSGGFRYTIENCGNGSWAEDMLTKAN